jgi:hypothetical protein
MKTLDRDMNRSPHKYVRKLQVLYWKYYWYNKKDIGKSLWLNQIRYSLNVT